MHSTTRQNHLHVLLLISFMLMRTFILILLAVLPTSSVDAASYQQNDGTIIDPIQLLMEYGGGNHSYAGINLEPDADLAGANLPLSLIHI